MAQKLNKVMNRFVSLACPNFILGGVKADEDDQNLRTEIPSSMPAPVLVTNSPCTYRSRM